MGGGFFDNMWDPYSAAYGYPRAQPRYYRSRAPVYERRPVYEQHPERFGASRVQPEDRFPSEVKVEEPVTRKTVRTIPVTDGNVAAEVKSAQKVEVVRPVVRRFLSGDDAATKIQAVYRGYAVRKTEPLKHLRVIMKVKEEFEGFKHKLQEKGQRAKLCSDSQERLRWTEGIMGLLLRLDQLQGVHPEVRLIRKAAAKELLMFQEKIDSMSDVSEEENVGNDDAVAERANVEEGSVAEESSEVCDAAEEVAQDGDMQVPVAEAVVDSMEVEETVSNVEDSKETPQAEVADGTIGATDEDQQTTMEQDSAPAEESSESKHDSDGIKVVEMLISEQHGASHEEVANHEDQGSTSANSIREDVVRDAVELGFIQAAAEVPMDVENEASTIVPARDLEEVEVEADSPQTVPPMDVEGDIRESSGALDEPAVTAPPTDFIDEPKPKEAELGESIEKTDLMEGHEVVGDAGDDPCTCSSMEDRVTDAGSEDTGDGKLIPACSMALEPQWSAKSLQVGQPQILTTGDTSSLSDRALLEQLLEENRKLRDVVGKVLHWGKQQNDIIHNLAGRIEQLEEHHPQSNMIQGAKGNGRKRICNDGALAAGDRDRSRSKGRRKGRQGNRPQLGYLDSEWLSPESEEYF